VKELTIGRIVHYVLSDGKGAILGRIEHRAAIVVRVFDSGKEEGLANLYVFLDGSNDARIPKPEGTTEMVQNGMLWATSVHPDETGTIPGTWHWPEIVKEAPEQS
jgi:hypothetical protein